MPNLTNFGQIPMGFIRGDRVYPTQEFMAWANTVRDRTGGTSTPVTNADLIPLVGAPVGVFAPRPVNAGPIGTVGPSAVNSGPVSTLSAVPINGGPV